MFGDEMPKLLNDIEQWHRNGKFKVLPIGPIGNHIEITDPKYRAVAENMLSQILQAFLVDNIADSLVLRNLTRQKYPNLKLTIIKSSFLNRVYNTSGKGVESSSRATALIDVMKVKNPNVMNCLIDQCSIETILLVDEYDFATHLTSKKENVPANLSKVILLEPYSEFYPAPKYRSYSKNLNPAKLLRVDESQRERYANADFFNAAISLFLFSYRTYRDDLGAAEARKAQLQDEYNSIQRKLQEARAHLRQTQENITKLSPEAIALKLNIHELEVIEYNTDSELGIMVRTESSEAYVFKFQTEMHRNFVTRS